MFSHQIYSGNHALYISQIYSGNGAFIGIVWTLIHLSNLFWKWGIYWDRLNINTFVKSILGMGLYWDRLNIIQLQALPGISSCLLIQPPPPDDFLQHTFGFDNTENILSIFFIVENIIHADNPVLIQSPHGGEFSQHTCHGSHNLVFVLHLYVYLFHLLCLFVCFLHQFVCFFLLF